jgi:hypothetical protein
MNYNENTFYINLSKLIIERKIEIVIIYIYIYIYLIFFLLKYKIYSQSMEQSEYYGH